jgi:hypothetical protein
MSVELILFVVAIMVVACFAFKPGSQEQDTSVSGESLGSLYTKGQKARRRSQGGSGQGSGASGFNSILDEGMATDTYLPSAAQIWNSLDEETRKKLGMAIGPEFTQQMVTLTAIQGEAIQPRLQLEDKGKLGLIRLRVGGNNLITTAKAKTALFQDVERVFKKIEAIEDDTTRGLSLISACDEIAYFLSENTHTCGHIGVAQVLRLYASTRRSGIQKPQAFQEAIEEAMASEVTTGVGEYEKLFDLYRGGDENGNGRRLTDG